MTGRRPLAAMALTALASAMALPSFSQNNYDHFLDSLKTTVNQHAYGNKWHRGSYRHRVPYRHIVSTPVVPDTADISYHERKHFWRSAAEVFGMNMSLWAFDRYVKKGNYAYISWASIKENFRHGFEWDSDHLHTNMFAHPYNGSLFYNAGRSNGFNFWQSELFAIGGSAMWELFMECEYPSTNDIIATPIGGAAMGEVFYRASDLVLNDRATGGERIWREVAAFVIDPMRGITRIVSGEAWKKRATSGRRFGLPPISIEASLGGRYLGMIDTKGWRMGPAAEINIEYGDRFEATTKTPYDYFSFNVELQTISTQPLLSRIEIIGRLLSRELIDEERLNMNIGMYQHFDYFDSDTIRKDGKNEMIPETIPYKLGVPASVGGGTMVRYIPTPKMSLDGYAYLNLMALAGISTDFYREDKRNYSWGMGFSVKSGINWALSNDKMSVKIANQFFWARTHNNFDSKYKWMLRPNGGAVELEGGDNGITTFNHLEAGINYRLYRNLYLTAGLDYYTRHTNYPDLEIGFYDSSEANYPSEWSQSYHIRSRQIGAHVMATYKF